MTESITKNSEQIISVLRERINEQLLKIINEYSSPESLYVPMKYVLEGSGKRIRPILTLLVAEMFGPVEESAMHVATSLEIMHNFTLVHDDIMDEDHQRRGRPTVHIKWDISTGILSGDGLIALAYKILLRAESARIKLLAEVFTDGLIDICEGQAYDKDFETRTNVSIDEYLMMIGKKTGRLLAMCCRMGGIINGADYEQQQHLEHFGYEIGQAFQIQDDLLELTSTMDVMGKSLGSDVFENKKTFLIIKAREMAEPGVKKQLDDLLAQQQHTETDFDIAKELLAQTGVIEYTQSEVRKRIISAKQSLDALHLNSGHIDYLTNQILHRKS